MCRRKLLSAVPDRINIEINWSERDKVTVTRPRIQGIDAVHLSAYFRAKHVSRLIKVGNVPWRLCTHRRSGRRLLGSALRSENSASSCSGNYCNVFDPSVEFMRGRRKDRSWRTPFRPDEEYDEYVESDAWQASFSVPHDVAGLIYG